MTMASEGIGGPTTSEHIIRGGQGRNHCRGLKGVSASEGTFLYLHRSTARILILDVGGSDRAVASGVHQDEKAPAQPEKVTIDPYVLSQKG